MRNTILSLVLLVVILTTSIVAAVITSNQILQVKYTIADKTEEPLQYAIFSTTTSKAILTSINFGTIEQGSSQRITVYLRYTGSEDASELPYYYVQWHINTELSYGCTLQGYWNGPETWNINTGRMWAPKDMVYLTFVLTASEDAIVTTGANFEIYLSVYTL